MARTIAGRYEIMDLIGQGGMADVYLAKDKILNRVIAVKILRTSLAKDPLYVARFKREASAAASLSHKNVVEIYDVGEDGDDYFIAMEYVTGVTLKELIHKRGALHVVEAIDIFKQVVAGVAAAHKLDIIHRDLKPQNILVTDSGIAKIADFGIASMESLAQVTKNDVIMGSLHYLAPELCRGEKATAQSDIYALGIVLYELLRGEVPFSGDTPVNIALKHMQEEIPSIREFNSTIYQSVENIITKATAKNLNDRYQSTDEMMADLRKCMDEPDQPKLVFAKVSYDDQPTIIASTQATRKMAKPGEERVDVLLKDDNPNFFQKNRKKIIIGAAVGAVLVVIALIAMLLGGNDRTFLMPDLTGKTVEEATSIIESYGATVSDEYEYQVTDDIDEGLVCATDPEAQSSASTGNEITLVLSSGMYIVVGDYVGEDINDVIAILEEENLDYSIEQVNSELASGEIISQSITPNTKIDPANEPEIVLTVSQGWSVQVPNLISRDIDYAKDRLQNLGLTVTLKTLTGEDLTNAQIDDIVLNTVVSQSIEPDTEITEPNTEIILEYYDVRPNKKDEYEVVMINYVGGDVMEARSDLLALGFVVNLETLDPTGLSQQQAANLNEDEVVSQSIPQNTVVTTRGTLITLYYYDSLPNYE